MTGGDSRKANVISTWPFPTGQRNLAASNYPGQEFLAERTSNYFKHLVTPQLFALSSFALDFFFIIVKQQLYKTQSDKTTKFGLVHKGLNLGSISAASKLLFDGLCRYVGVVSLSLS